MKYMTVQFDEDILSWMFFQMRKRMVLQLQVFWKYILLRIFILTRKLLTIQI